MRKDWSNQDVARMTYLTEKYGKSDGIKLFSKESGRSENSIRIKLLRLQKEIIVQNAENKAYNELETAKAENNKTLRWFSKIVNFLTCKKK